MESRVSLWNGFHGLDRRSSSALVGGLEPATGELALGQVWTERRAHPRAPCATDTSGADVLEDHDPVRIVLVDGCVERQRDGTHDRHVVRQRLGHVPAGRSTFVVLVTGIWV